MRLWPAALILVSACGSEPAPGPAAVHDEPVPPVPMMDLSTLAEPLREAALADQRKAAASPGDPEAVGRLGMRYLAHDFPRAAAACLARAARLEPANAKWKYDEALALEAAGMVAEAAGAYEEAIGLDPSYVPAHVRLGSLLLETDRGRSRMSYERALALDPDSAEAHFGLGRIARMEGRRDEALERFRRAVGLLPGYADAHYAIAMILSAAGRREEASPHIEAYSAGGPPPLDRDPYKEEIARLGESASLLRDRAEAMALEGEVEEAVALLEKAIARDVSGSTSHIHLGLILAREGRFERAAEEFAAALEADPDSVEAKSSLGLALTEMGRIDEARSHFEEVLRAHPAHAPSLVYLGRLEARAGNDTEAVDLLRRGVEAQPANGLYQFTLGDHLARMGQEGNALPHLEKAVLLSPGSARARHALAVVLARLGDLDRAGEQWRETIRLAPGMADAHLGLAGIALQRNDPAAAVRHAERACELTRYGRPRHLETLAEAYRAAGRPADAERIRGLIP